MKMLRSTLYRNHKLHLRLPQLTITINANKCNRHFAFLTNNIQNQLIILNTSLWLRRCWLILFWIFVFRLCVCPTLRPPSPSHHTYKELSLHVAAISKQQNTFAQTARPSTRMEMSRFSIHTIAVYDETRRSVKPKHKHKQQVQLNYSGHRNRCFFFIQRVCVAVHVCVSLNILSSQYERAWYGYLVRGSKWITYAQYCIYACFCNSNVHGRRHPSTMSSVNYIRKSFKSFLWCWAAASEKLFWLPKVNMPHIRGQICISLYFI